MSTRKDDIEALLEHSQNKLVTIEKEYNKSIREQNISALLKIEIKEYCEHLRSVLDYIAHDIREKYCPPLTKRDKIYFPISKQVDDHRNILNKWYPNLNQSCSELNDYLYSIQAFSNPNNNWLIEFNQINNNNKHNKLISQNHQYERYIAINASVKDIKSIAWHKEVNEDGEIIREICFTDNVKISTCPILNDSNRIYKKISVLVEYNDTLFTTIAVIIAPGIYFEDITEISSIELLKQSHQGIQQIYTDISKWLYQ